MTRPVLSAPPGITSAVLGIEVEEGPLPPPFGEACGPRGVVHADHRRSLIRPFDGVGAYVEDGARIVIQVTSRAERLQHDYLAYAFAARELLQQQGRFPLHATLLISPEERAIAVTGDSGVGKSTTTIELVARGWRFSCDDVVEVSTDGEVTAIPLGRPIHLSDAAAVRLGADPAIGRELPQRDKRVYSLEGDLTARPLSAIVRLRCQPVPTVTDEILTSLDALPPLAHHSDRYGSNRSPRWRAAYLAWLARIVSDVEVFNVVRPVEGDSVNEVADRVERLVRG